VDNADEKRTIVYQELFENDTEENTMRWGPSPVVYLPVMFLENVYHPF